MKRTFALLGVVVVLCALMVAGLTAEPVAGDTVVFGPANYVRTAGPPVSNTASFTVTNPGSNFKLRIENGGTNGQFSRVSSGVLTLAIVGQPGTPVTLVAPSDFGQNVAVIEKQISLGLTNSLVVELRSQPGSGITV